MDEESKSRASKLMSALPYMRFYVGDYLGDTYHLTTEEHGAYLLLIMAYWQSGKPIPKDRLASAARMTNERWNCVEETLKDFFVVGSNELWVHERIELELERVLSQQTQASLAGKASAAKRAKNKANSNGRSTVVQQEIQRTFNHTYTDTDTDTDKKPLSGKPDPSPKSNAKEILNFLNEKTGKQYQPVDANINLILARLKEYDEKSLMQVIAKKTREWSTDDKMCQFLRPKTLFNATNFANYAGELVI